MNICQNKKTFQVHEGPPIICSRWQFQILLLLQNNKYSQVVCWQENQKFDPHQADILPCLIWVLTAFKGYMHITPGKIKKIPVFKVTQPGET